MEALIDVLQSVSIIVASVTAIWGIASWRHEFVGKRRIELAEDILSRFYEARDLIAIIRNPLGYSDEGKTRPRGEHETPQETKDLDSAFVIFERYNRYSEFFNQLQAVQYRAIAQLGEAARLPFENLLGPINDILSARQDLTLLTQDEEVVNRYGRQRSPQEEQARDEDFRRLRRILWQTFSGNDLIADRVDTAVKDMERICRDAQDVRLPFLRLDLWRHGKDASR